MCKPTFSVSGRAISAWRRLAGFTLIELMVSLVMIATLASVALPMVQLTVKRQKEQQLRAHLHEIRKAIDAYKKAADDGRIKKNADASGYPPSLEVLVDGVENSKDPRRSRLKFLRRIPRDPMLAPNGSATASWGLRSYDSPPDQPRTGQDVYDVYSLSTETGINGVPYAAW